MSMIKQYNQITSEKNKEHKKGGYIYIPEGLQDKPNLERPFCEKYEYNIKFLMMILFAISLILLGPLITNLINNSYKK